MKKLHVKAMQAYLRGDLKQWERKPTYRPEHFIPSIDEYEEDNAARAFHKFVVIYFGGDYERARDFVNKLVAYRNKHAKEPGNINDTT